MNKVQKVKAVIGILLLIVALILAGVFIPIGFIIGTIVNVFKGSPGTYFRDIAISIDQGGNVVLRDLLDITMIKSRKNSKLRFGHEDDTISCVLGRDQVANNLSPLGQTVSFILDMIEKDHCKNSIEERVINISSEEGPLLFLRKNIKALKDRNAKVIATKNPMDILEN